MLLTSTPYCTLKDGKISKYFQTNLILIGLLLGPFLVLISMKGRSLLPSNIRQSSPSVLSYSWRNYRCLTSWSEEIQRFTKRNGSVCSATKNRNPGHTSGDVRTFLRVLSLFNKLLNGALKTSYL